MKILHKSFTILGLTVLALFVLYNDRTMTSIAKKFAVIDLKSYTTAHSGQNCSLWMIPRRLNIPRDPLIKLNPNLFLYPGMVGGPNNQIKGFHQSIYLAIKLNR